MTTPGLEPPERELRTLLPDLEGISWSELMDTALDHALEQFHAGSEQVKAPSRFANYI